MKNLNNQTGYALVTVLLMIAVFMVISLSFMGQSFSSVKQNKVVENDYQSVALAEMGVEYYQGRVMNALKETEALGKIDSGDILTKVEASLKDEKIEMKNQEADSYFRITQNDGIQDFASLNKEKNELVIQYKSTGSSENKETVLRAKMTIPLKSGSSQSTNLPDFNQIKMPENIPGKCKNPAIIYDSCEEILVLGSGSYPENYNSLDDKVIYTTGAFALDGNANNMDHTQIHTEGSMTLGKNMNNASYVTLEIKGAMSFGGQLRLESSKVFVGGSMSLDGHMDIENNTYTYIGGSASISKHLFISENSKMCVGGNLDASQINIDGKLFVKGSVKGDIKSGHPTYVSDKDFVKNCGISGSGQTSTIIWDGINSEIDYK